MNNKLHLAMKSQWTRMTPDAAHHRTTPRNVEEHTRQLERDFWLQARTIDKESTVVSLADLDSSAFSTAVKDPEETPSILTPKENVPEEKEKDPSCCSILFGSWPLSMRPAPTHQSVVSKRSKMSAIHLVRSSQSLLKMVVTFRSDSSTEEQESDSITQTPATEAILRIQDAILACRRAYADEFLRLPTEFQDQCSERAIRSLRCLFSELRRAERLDDRQRVVSRRESVRIAKSVLVPVHTVVERNELAILDDDDDDDLTMDEDFKIGNYMTNMNSSKEVLSDLNAHYSTWHLLYTTQDELEKKDQRRSQLAGTAPFSYRTRGSLASIPEDSGLKVRILLKEAKRTFRERQRQMRRNQGMLNDSDTEDVYLSSDDESTVDDDDESIDSVHRKSARDLAELDNDNDSMSDAQSNDSHYNDGDNGEYYALQRMTFSFLPHLDGHMPSSTPAIEYPVCLGDELRKMREEEVNVEAELESLEYSTATSRILDESSLEYQSESSEEEEDEFLKAPDSNPSLSNTSASTTESTDIEFDGRFTETETMGVAHYPVEV